MSKSAGYSCRACQRTWKRNSDLTQHYMKTTNTVCRKEADTFIAKLRTSHSAPRRSLLQRRRLPFYPSVNDKSAGPKDNSKAEHDDESESATPFVGDFFGQDYASEDFPGLADEDDDDDDEEEEAVIIAESPWEPERPQRTCFSDTDTVDDSPTNIPQPANLLLHQLPSHRNDIYVQRFGGQAGAPLPTLQPSHFRNSRDGFEQYQASIADSDINMWAPFTSKVDWEMARWAKMRGPGSTAFSDLLAIDGVRFPRSIYF